MEEQYTREEDKKEAEKEEGDKECKINKLEDNNEASETIQDESNEQKLSEDEAAAYYTCIKKEKTAEELLQKEEKSRRIAFFHNLCEKIQKNDPTFRSYEYPLMLDDDTALSLARALNGNTHLKFLRILIGPKMTAARGARALVSGMSGSQVTELIVMHFEDVFPLAMADLVLRAIQRAESIMLALVMSEELAALVGPVLTEHKSLHHFAFQVEHMTPRAAELMAAGIRGARHLTKVDISLRHYMSVAVPSEEVMRTLLLQGVVQGSSSNVQKLALFQIVGDMHAVATVMPSLRHLSLDDVVINDEMAAILGEALVLTDGRIHSSLLDSLAISVWDMTPHAAFLISNGIRRNSVIKRLELNLSKSKYVPPETIQTFYQEIFQETTTNTNMEYLSLSGVLGDIAFLISTVLPRLGELTISDVPLSVDDTIRLSRGIVTLASKLHTLHLNNCGLKFDHMNVLTSVITKHPPLKCRYKRQSYGRPRSFCVVSQLRFRLGKRPSVAFSR